MGQRSASVDLSARSRDNEGAAMSGKRMWQDTEHGGRNEPIRMTLLPFALASVEAGQGERGDWGIGRHQHVGWHVHPGADHEHAEVIERLRTALRVQNCEHDNSGPADESSGFPTCSKCGAILTAAPVPAAEGWMRPHAPHGLPNADGKFLWDDRDGHWEPKESWTPLPAQASGSGGLDRNLLGRAIHRVFHQGAHGPGADDGDGDLAAAILDEYAELAADASEAAL